MGVKTHLVDYQLGEEHIDELIDSLKKNGMNKLGENGRRNTRYVPPRIAAVTSLNCKNLRVFDQMPILSRTR